MTEKRKVAVSKKKTVKPPEIKKQIKLNEDEKPIAIFRKKLQFMLSEKYGIKIPLSEVKGLADSVMDVAIAFLADGDGQYIGLGTEGNNLRMKIKPMNARLHVNLGGRETAAIGERNTIVTQNLQVGAYLKSVGITREEFKRINGHDDYEFTPVSDPEVLKSYGMTPAQNADNWDIIRDQIEGYDEDESDTD